MLNDNVKSTAKRRTMRAFLISLVVMFLLSLLNWGVITGWGDVKITRLNLVGDNGYKYSALMYVPKNATNKTPAPGILMFHGNSGNARNHESWATEFSRRGFVCIAVDQFGGGESYYYKDEGDNNALAKVGELFYTYMESLPFVNNDLIIASGHSMGGACATAVGAKHNAKAIIGASASLMGVDVTVFKDKAIEGYPQIQEWKGNFLDTIGDCEAAAISRKLPIYLDMLKDRGFVSQDAMEYEIGKLYGSFEEGNAHMTILEENRVHEAAFVDKGTIQNILWFGQEAIGQENVPNYIPADNMVWMYKDWIGFVLILSFAVFVCMTALMLIEWVPAFAIVKNALPRNIGLRKIGLAISIICAIAFPIIVLKTGTFGLTTIIEKNANNINSLYPLRVSARGLGTIIGLNLLGLVTLLLFIFTDGRKQKATIEDFGFAPTGSGNKISVKQVAVTLLLSLIVVAIAWGYVHLNNAMFGTDLYSQFFGVKTIPFGKVRFYPPYIITWILCFIIASCSINVERRLPSTGNEKLDTAIAVIFNVVLGAGILTLVMVIDNNIAGGTVAQTFTNDIYATAGTVKDPASVFNITSHQWGMPLGMTVGIGGSTYLYRKTGNAWLSAILMGIVASMMCVLFGQTRFMI